MAEELESIEAFEAKETSRKLPVGWLVLFFGLIAWGIWYLLAYTPAVSGWTQEKAYQESARR